MRTKWIYRFDTFIAEKATKPGVWRRKDGGFVVRARVRDPRTGKDREIRRILPDATLEESIVHLAEERKKVLQSDMPVPAPKLRFRDYAQALFEKKIQTGQVRSASSRRRWKTVLKMHLLPRLGDVYMSELRRADLLALHEHLSRLMVAGRYAPNSCATIFKLAKVIARAFAQEHSQPDIALGLPNFDLSFRRTYTREQPNSLRPPETEAFLAVVRKRYPQHLCMVTLGFALGLRPSSLRALHKVDILWEDGWLLNRRSHTLGQEIMERTKIGKDTEVPLSPELLDMLRQHVESLPAGPMRDSPLLFPNPQGKLLARHAIGRVFEGVEPRLGLTKKITPRAMRRTSKDLLRMSGASQVVAMAINGHHTDAMHYHYSTVNEAEVREVLSRTVQLMGLRSAKTASGGKSGGKVLRKDCQSAPQRRESCVVTAKCEFSTGVSPLAQALACMESPMSGPDPGVVAVSLACCYSLWWCLSLARRLRRIERASKFDPLTGLGSGDWLQSERWPAALRSGLPLAVLYLDLEHLKWTNDTRGHAVGDRYICTAAEVLSQAVRRGVDEVFRSHRAGDEFEIIMSGPISDPRGRAESLLQRLSERGVSASLGLAYTTVTQFVPARAELRQRAEAACRQAKARGGGCAVVAGPVLGALPLAASPEPTDLWSSAPQTQDAPEPHLLPNPSLRPGAETIHP